MPKLTILNSKQTKEVLNLVENQFGARFTLDYAFLKSEKNEIYAVSRDIKEINLDKLRIDSIGLFLGEIRNNEFIPTIEGSQIIGKAAKKSVFDVDEEQAKEWVKGENLTINTKLRGIVLIKRDNDFLGCGKIAEGKIINHTSKDRRLKDVI